jgi:hypothetical protein
MCHMVLHGVGHGSLWQYGTNKGVQWLGNRHKIQWYSAQDQASYGALISHFSGIFATHVKNSMTLKVLKCWTLYPLYYVVLCTSRLHPGRLFLLSRNKIVGSFVTCDVWPGNVDWNALKNWRENSDIHFMHKQATLIPYWVVLKYQVHSW